MIYGIKLVLLDNKGDIWIGRGGWTDPIPPGTVLGQFSTEDINLAYRRRHEMALFNSIREYYVEEYPSQ